MAKPRPLLQFYIFTFFNLPYLFCFDNKKQAFLNLNSSFLAIGYTLHHNVPNMLPPLHVLLH